MNGSRGCGGAPPPSTSTSSADSGLAAAERLRNLQQVESRVAHHRRDGRSSAQIDEAPEGAEESRRDRRVGALQQVPGPECGTGDDHADLRAAEPGLEAVEQKRALNLFTHAAGQDGD